MENLKRENKNDIPIIEGHDSGGYFWIHPCNMKEKIECGYWDMVDLADDEISISEDDVWEYLAYFFLKHFDSDLKVNTLRCFRTEDMTVVYKIEDFEWYLEHNLYTYASMNAILEDIENLCVLVLNDAESEIICQYAKQKFYNYNEIDLYKNIFYNHNYAKEDVLKFYKKFVSYISEMMKKNSDFNYFSVMGP